MVTSLSRLGLLGLATGEFFSDLYHALACDIKKKKLWQVYNNFLLLYIRARSSDAKIKWGQLQGAYFSEKKIL